MHKSVLIILLFLLASTPASAYVWEVHCDHALGHFRFGPSQFPMNSGDTIHFILDQGCAAKEVSQATYNSRDTIWNGGAQTPAGGGYVVLTSPGHHYFVCPQHAAVHEILDVEVWDPAIVITSLSKLASCAGDSITVAYVYSGVFAWDNEFEVQLSDSLGDFSAPTVLGVFDRSTFFPYYGQLGSIVYDTVQVRIRSSIPAGNGYRLRIVSRLHGVTGTPYPLAIRLFDSNPSRFEWVGALSSEWGRVGNWDSPCAIPGTGDTVIISSGPAPPAHVPAITLGRLVLQNSGGLRLGGDLRITGELSLQYGCIALGNARLTIAAGATVSAGGPNRLVLCDSAGSMCREGLASTSGSALFPVGTAPATYTPLWIANAGTSDDFCVRVIPEVFAGGISGTPVTDGVVACTWLIEEAQPGNSLATMRFQWDSALEYPGFDRNDCFVARHDGAMWTPLQTAGVAFGSEPFERYVGGVTAFSPFAIGSTGSAVPVAFRSFTAEARDGVVLLQWETEREVSNFGFFVERQSRATFAWETRQFVAARGGEGRGAAYTACDIPPQGGTWTYRLRQVDLDGTAAHTPAIAVSVGEAASPVADRSPHISSVWPHPLRASRSKEVSVSCRIPESGSATLSLFDPLGRCVAETVRHEAAAGVETGLTWLLPPLPPGLYLLRLEAAGKADHQPLLVLE